MPTRSVHLSDTEAEGLQHLHETTGETEDQLLERAVQRGLQELRIEEGIRVFRATGSSSEAAAISGMPRAALLYEMAERGVILLEGPSTFAADLVVIAQDLQDERLAAAAQELSPGHQ